jgi:hypothetical protein
MPRRPVLDFERAVPRVRALPSLFRPKAEPGAQPEFFSIDYGGAEPRLTSGGEAATQTAQTAQAAKPVRQKKFQAKPVELALPESLFLNFFSVFSVPLWFNNARKTTTEAQRHRGSRLGSAVFSQSRLNSKLRSHFAGWMMRRSSAA